MKSFKNNIIASALLVAMLAFVSVDGYSQEEIANTSSEHLTFMEIPIDGSAYKYARQLEKRKFKINRKYYKKTGSYMLTGTFEGYRNCTIYLDHSPKENQIYAVQVQLPNRDNWHDLNSDYEYLSNMIKKQYGKPIKVVADFNTERVPKTEMDRYNALLQQRCIYGSMFETDYGLIIVYLDNPIDENDIMHCHATVYYLDNLNYDFFNEEVQN